MEFWCDVIAVPKTNQSSKLLKLTLVANSQGCFCLLGDSNENKPTVGAEEEEVAKMGCPSLGEHTQIEVVIEESYEFKVAFPIPNMKY